MVELLNLIVLLLYSPTLTSYLLTESLELIRIKADLDVLVLEADFGKFSMLVTLF